MSDRNTVPERRIQRDRESQRKSGIERMACRVKETNKESNRESQTQRARERGGERGERGRGRGVMEEREI